MTLPSTFGTLLHYQDKKIRKFCSKVLSQHWPYRYGNGKGKLTGGIKVLIVKGVSRYLPSSLLSLSIQQVKSLYRLRQYIQKVVKILKSQLAWDISLAPAQMAQLHLSLMAFCLLQPTAFARNSTPYQFRHLLFRQTIPSYSNLL